MRMSLIIVLMLCLSMASGEISHTFDAQGEGYLWTGSDVGSNHDRAGGSGSWTYGQMADSQMMMSLYQFSGQDGFYRVANQGNISQFAQASDLSEFNASVMMDNESVSLEMNGTGRIKMVLSQANLKGQPEDLSRTYISGRFEIADKHNVGAW